MKIKLFLSLLWTIFILIGSITSGETINKIGWINIPHFDKIVHFTWYFVLYLFWYSWLIAKYTNCINLNCRFFLASVIIVYGLLMELLQMFFAYQRSFEINDILINSIGAGIALIVFFPLYQSKIFGRFL